jgi:ABC-type amino acid transport substrate-binding protein
MAATVAIRALNIAMLLNPAGLIIAAIVALGTAIILLIEDIYQWVAGNESAIGDLLGSWEDFKNKFIGYLSNSVEAVKEKLAQIKGFFVDTFTQIKEFVTNIFKNIWDGITNGISSAFDKIKSYIPDINLNPFSSTPKPTIQGVLGANGNSSNSVINDNKNINITVPPGTTTEQVEAIKNEINKTMQQQYTDAALHLEGY